MAARINQNNLPVDENGQAIQNSDSKDYSERRIGRNEPCPCGSGKKYKHCHGSRAARH